MGRAKYVFSYNMRQNRCIYTKTREVCTQRRSSPRLQPILLFNAIHCFQVSPFLCCQKTLRNSPMECGVSPSVGLNRAPVWRKIPLTLSHFLGWKAAATPAALSSGFEVDAVEDQRDTVLYQWVLSFKIPTRNAQDYYTGDYKILLLWG